MIVLRACIDDAQRACYSVRLGPFPALNPAAKQPMIHATRLLCFRKIGACLLLLWCGGSSGHVAAGEEDYVAATVQGRTFRIPKGFVLEVVAGPRIVERPIHAAFDEAGHLYVSDSSGTNDNVAVQLEEQPHRILRLTDFDGDGHYDESIVFADRLMFPEGTLWYEGSLYVSAPPKIWKITDTDGDGISDQREVWFDGKTLTGCANDLHGPYLGLDGWIYWAKGAFATQSYDRVGKEPWVTRAAHIFRSHPDGSLIEPVMTGGMDNPVDVVFMPNGERLFNGTFFQHPAGGHRDGIIHSIYGGIYGKIHDPIFDPIHKWTGPEVMPILVHLGPAAPSGFHRYESSAWGPEYRDNLFSTCFNLRKVTRHVLSPQGATYSATSEDFVSTDDIDFHPTDVIEDADGSLIILNTGGWYKLCCPTSQLHKPDILGCIYRLRKVDAQPTVDPRGLQLEWQAAAPETLVPRLDDPRPAVRERAIRTLTRSGAASVPALQSLFNKSPPASVDARRNALWTAIRIDNPSARDMVRSAVDDSDESIRQVAFHGISLWRDTTATPQLLKGLAGPSAHNCRVSAEALGRIGVKSATRPLLDAIPSASGDRVLEHSLVYALIELGDSESLLEALASDSAATPLGDPRRLAALIALDQIGGSLTPEQLIPHLTAHDTALLEGANWIALRHPEWGGSLVEHWRKQLDLAGKPESNPEEIANQIARFAATAEIQHLLATIAMDSTQGTDSRIAAMRAMRQASLETSPVTWIDAVTQALADINGSVQDQAIVTAHAFMLPEDWPKDPTFRQAVSNLDNALQRIGTDSAALAERRVQALASRREGLHDLDSSLFEFLRDQFHADASVPLRTGAAEALSRSKLSESQLQQLATVVAQAGPFEIEKLLAPFEGCVDDVVGQVLLSALQQSPAISAIRPDRVRPVIASFGAEVRSHVEAFLSSLNVDAETQRNTLETLLAQVPTGDIRRGQAVFNNPKVACIACHAIGYVGGQIGPDLSRIGSVRADRDLLEAILYPSASFVRSFEPLTVITTDGRVLNGTVKRDTPNEIVLTLSATEEARIPRGSIEEIQPGSVSIMPAGLDRQLTPQELADLVAFLKGND